MYGYYLLTILFFPILIKSENCTVLWDINNFKSRMKIKMCIEPIEQSVLFEGDTIFNIFNNLSKLANISNNETFLINESISNFSFSPSPSSKLNETNYNISNPPSSSDEEFVETVIIPVVPSPTAGDSPSPYIRAHSIIDTNSPSTSDVNDTLLKKNHNSTDIDKFDTTAFVSILSISLIVFFGLLTYVIKKRKRQNVQPLCKFNNVKKKNNSLERPKDYIIEHMVKNPINEEKKGEEKEDKKKKTLLMLV